jgi:hypothetical protein
MRILITTLALVTCLLGWNRVEAAIISVDAGLSHVDLSVASPIDFTVRFPTSFASIDLLTIDSLWIGDGLDAGETVAYTPGLGGVGVFPGGTTQFFRRLTIPAALGFDLSPFLDGAFDGTIYADRDAYCQEFGVPCIEGTTVTFDRLVFTADGEPIPEPTTLALVVMGVTPLLLGSRARIRRVRGQARSD